MVQFTDAMVSRGTIEVYVSHAYGDKVVEKVQEQVDVWLKEKLEELRNEAETQWPQAKVRAWIDE